MIPVAGDPPPCLISRRDFRDGFGLKRPSMARHFPARDYQEAYEGGVSFAVPDSIVTVRQRVDLRASRHDEVHTLQPTLVSICGAAFHQLKVPFERPLALKEVRRVPVRLLWMSERLRTHWIRNPKDSKTTRVFCCSGDPYLPSKWQDCHWCAAEEKAEVAPNYEYLGYFFNSERPFFFSCRIPAPARRDIGLLGLLGKTFVVSNNIDPTNPWRTHPLDIRYAFNVVDERLPINFAARHAFSLWRAAHDIHENIMYFPNRYKGWVPERAGRSRRGVAA